MGYRRRSVVFVCIRPGNQEVDVSVGRKLWLWGVVLHSHVHPCPGCQGEEFLRAQVVNPVLRALFPVVSPGVFTLSEVEHKDPSSTEEQKSRSIEVHTLGARPSYLQMFLVPYRYRE